MPFAKATELSKQFPFFKAMRRKAFKAAERQDKATELVELFQRWSAFSRVEWLRNIVHVRDSLVEFNYPKAFLIHRYELMLSERDAKPLMEEFCAFCDWNKSNSWLPDDGCLVAEFQQLTIDSFDLMLKQTFQRALYFGQWTQKLSSLCRELSRLPSSLQIHISRLEFSDGIYFADGGHGLLFRARLRDDEPAVEPNRLVVAVKFVKYVTSQEQNRMWTSLHEEALSLLNLDLPGLNPFLGVTFEAKRGLGLVSKYQEHGNVVSYLEGRNASAADRIFWICTEFPLIVSAVHQLHYVKLTHSDIKGANILIDEYGRPCLTDFGLARLAADQLSEGGSKGSESGSYFYTLRFCSPERMKSPLDFCALPDDIWALGMTIVELLTGKKPFPELIDPEVFTELYNHSLTLHRSHVPTAVGDNLWEVIRGCTEVDAQKRWPSLRVYTAMQCIHGDCALGGESMLSNK